MKQLLSICYLLFLFLPLYTYAKIDGNPKKVSLYWDKSFSMGDTERLTNDEIELVSEYLKGLKNVSVEIVEFGLNTLKPQIFKVLNGDTHLVTDYLRNIEYGGGTDFAKVLIDNAFNADIAFLFSDGISMLNSPEWKIKVPIFCVNSIEKGNHKILSEIARESGGAYIRLTKENFENSLAILNGSADIEFSSENEIYYELTGKVSGDNDEVLCGATIQVENDYNTATTNSRGEYSIRIRRNDVLTFNYVGKEEKTVDVSGQKTLDVYLPPQKVILIDEVAVKGKRKRKPEMVMTSYGEKDKAAVGYSVREIKSEDIKPAYQHVFHIFQGLPGIEVDREGVIQITKNKNSSMNNNKPPIVAIDGVPYPQEIIARMDPSMIDNVVILSTLAGTNKYGSEGAFGVIEITTKANSGFHKNTENSSSALAKGNDYNEHASSVDSIDNKTRDFEEIENASSFEDAYKLYKDRKKNLHSISYYIDVSDYFLDWDKDISLNILTGIMDLAYQDMNSLRALAYKLEERGENNLARKVYEYIAEKEPERIQSYRDLALISSVTGDIHRAEELYQQMTYNQIDEVDFSPVEKVLGNETFHFAKKDFEASQQEWLKPLYNPEYKTDIRIVFEWSEPGVEFELQFVNPQKKFFKWEHTLSGNKERMKSELESGFNMEEFVLDDAKLDGEWIINLKTINSDDKNQAYLKYTVYWDYGMAGEKKSLRVVKLDTNGENVTLERFVY